MTEEQEYARAATVHSERLELQRFCETCAADVTVLPDHIDRSLRQRSYLLVWQVFGQKKVASYTFRCPLDWWQHLKQRWFPKWALDRWPVKLREEVFEVEAMRLLPGLKAPPGQRVLDLISYEGGPRR